MYVLEYIRIKELQFLRNEDNKRHFWKRKSQFQLYKPQAVADLGAFDDAGLLININMAYPELFSLYVDWERNLAEYFAEICHNLQDRRKSFRYKQFCTYTFWQFGTIAVKTLFFVQNLYVKSNYIRFSARYCKEITLRSDSDEDTKLTQELFDGTLLPVKLEEFGNLPVGHYTKSKEDLLLIEAQQNLELAQKLYEELNHS
ncbi:hypothetical protein O6H91_Y398700 [Diphasiastrum complanatum]|nr:hypothetical protein O6H91_Y398700 [Diphasiastrum complanatum]